jgi:selenide,water dikinase
LKAELIGPESYLALIDSMTALNKRAAEIVRAHGTAHSVTDVTGFGLVGHAMEMASGSGLTITIEASDLPVLPGALDAAKSGIVPVGTYVNREHLRGKTDLPHDLPEELSDIWFDPQTSGGLLIAVPEKAAQTLLCALQKEIPVAGIVGVFRETRNGEARPIKIAYRRSV